MNPKKRQGLRAKLRPCIWPLCGAQDEAERTIGVLNSGFGPGRQAPALSGGVLAGRTVTQRFTAA
jgi:hypothetical protein